MQSVIIDWCDVRVSVRGLATQSTLKDFFLLPPSFILLLARTTLPESNKVWESCNKTFGASIVVVTKCDGLIRHCVLISMVQATNQFGTYLRSAYGTSINQFGDNLHVFISTTALLI